jgi:hypothetical protein
MINIQAVWALLREIEALQFKSESRSSTNWSGAGQGSVKVLQITPEVLIFEESGRWRQNGGQEIRFTNVYRWTYATDRIRLEHLRFGRENPVFLFEMAPDAEGIWRDINPHLCRDDCYSAALRTAGGQLFLQWSVNGPTRNESIDYVYI